MTDRQFKIFLSVYFADKAKLEEFQAGDEPGFRFENYNCGSGKISFDIPLMEILQMNIDCWNSMKDKTKIENMELVNPKLFFHETEQCIDLLINKGLTPCPVIEYEKYINLIYCFENNENWFEKEEMERFEKEGYRNIDLELINQSVKRNQKKVIKLLDQGANPMIDPDDKIAESEIMEMLKTADSFHFTNVASFHETFKESGNLKFDRKEANFMIAELYGSASSAKLYDLIKSRIPE